MTLGELAVLLQEIPDRPPAADDIVWNNGGVICFRLSGSVAVIPPVIPPVTTQVFALLLEDGSGRWMLEDGTGAWGWG